MTCLFSTTVTPTILLSGIENEGEAPESSLTNKRSKFEALAFLRKALGRHGQAAKIVMDGLRLYPAATRQLGNLECREMFW